MASVFVELDPGAHAVFGGGEGAMTVGAMTVPTSYLVRSLCDLHALFAAVCFTERGGGDGVKLTKRANQQTD